MVVLDSCVWIALLNTADIHHGRARTLIKEINETVLVPEYVFLEVCNVLVARNKKNIAEEFGNLIESNEDCELIPSSDEFFKHVRDLFRQCPSKKLSFVDVSLLLLGREYAVITFDNELEKYLKLKKTS